MFHQTGLLMLENTGVSQAERTVTVTLEEPMTVFASVQTTMIAIEAGSLGPGDIVQCDLPTVDGRPNQEIFFGIAYPKSVFVGDVSKQLVFRLKVPGGIHATATYCVMQIVA